MQGAGEDSTQDNNTPRVLLTSLHADILLHVLSYCKPADVCRFWRCCSYAMEFVESNLSHLPRREINLLIQTEENRFKYELYDITGNLGRAPFFAEPWHSPIELAGVRSRAVYFKVRKAFMVCDTDSLETAKFIATEFTSLNFSRTSFEWRFKGDSILKLTSEDLSNPIQMSNLPLEILLKDQDDENYELELHGLLLAVMQSKGRPEVHLRGSFELDECYDYYFKALKALKDRPNTIQPCIVGFPFIDLEIYYVAELRFWGPYSEGRYDEDGEKEKINALRAALKRHSLSLKSKLMVEDDEFFSTYYITGAKFMPSIGRYSIEISFPRWWMSKRDREINTRPWAC